MTACYNCLFCKSNICASFSPNFLPQICFIFQVSFCVLIRILIIFIILQWLGYRRGRSKVIYTCMYVMWSSKMSLKLVKLIFLIDCIHHLQSYLLQQTPLKLVYSKNIGGWRIAKTKGNKGIVHLVWLYFRDVSTQAVAWIQASFFSFRFSYSGFYFSGIFRLSVKD